MVPTFASSVKEYTAETDTATSSITATPTNEDDSVEIKFNGDVVEQEEEINWEEGENIVAVKVTDSEAPSSTTYIVTVTYTLTYVYTEVDNPTGSPAEQGWYEKVDNEYVLSEDTEVDEDKTYYNRSIK